MRVFTALECTESSCSCKPLFAPPDCCKCTNGDEPKDGVCSGIYTVNMLKAVL